MKWRKKYGEFLSIINSRVDETMMCVCMWMGIRMIACERGGEIFTQFLHSMEYMVMSCRTKSMMMTFHPIFSSIIFQLKDTTLVQNDMLMRCCMCVCVRETADMCSVLCIACTFHYGIETETSTREQIEFFGYCCVPSTVLSSSRNGWRVSRLVERTQPFIHSNV